jgi:hypothetical protein
MLQHLQNILNEAQARTLTEETVRAATGCPEPNRGCGAVKGRPCVGYASVGYASEGMRGKEMPLAHISRYNRALELLTPAI